ncbi:MAG: hypothetical protein A2219_08605 [Elusimicrobia bacterium RIFOXYA2_FULL_50_26]|nr:MAG: hypothetical protein A2219_08605 [Elusimicrobia bacterium RIFOXYA2_FULL_50_26]
MYDQIEYYKQHASDSLMISITQTAWEYAFVEERSFSNGTIEGLKNGDFEKAGNAFSLGNDIAGYGSIAAFWSGSIFGGAGPISGYAWAKIPAAAGMASGLLAAGCYSVDYAFNGNSRTGKLAMMNSGAAALDYGLGRTLGSTPKAIHWAKSWLYTSGELTLHTMKSYARIGATQAISASYGWIGKQYFINVGCSCGKKK